ncbi:MAG: phosphoribosylglycinamide formyltransferase, partial [Candidatus Heimdallarchaeaceae archaeon]
MNIAVLISGRGSNLKAILDAEKKKKIICLDPEKFNTNNEYDAELAKIIKNYNIELIVLAGFMRILSPSFVKLFRNRIINIHPSLLPSFPGLKAQKQA